MGMIVAGIPSNRAELCKEAVEAWKATGEFDEIWVMWDDTRVPLDRFPPIPKRIFRHETDEPSCIPTGSGCCRSRLVLEAWKNPDVEWLVHLDDDVTPQEGQWRKVIPGEEWHSRWISTMQGYRKYPRGHPYSEREKHDYPRLVHGMWNGVPDWDAVGQLNAYGESYKHDMAADPRVVPYGLYFAMSSMAVAIHRDLFPASYFLWMGKDLPLNKFGDIWCGVILKRICDHFGWLVTSGAPVVYHERASNVWDNLRQECKAIAYNEYWWRWVDAVDLRLCRTVSQCYRQIATQMEMPKTAAFEELRAKMMEWINLFDK